MPKERYIAIDAAEVEKQVANLFTDYADELADDFALRADLVEGETDLHSIMSRIIDHRQEALGMVAMIKERASHLDERKKRFEARAGAMTALALRLMQVAQQTKLVIPEASISILEGKDSVVIDDLDELPQGAYRIKKEADKVAIKESIQSGSEIPGARLERGADTIQVRLK